MLKHIVVWRLHPSPSVRENAERAKALLEGLAGQIPGLRHIEVGINLIDDVNAADIALYSELDDRAALDAYQRHPLHLAVVPHIKAMASERRSVDYEV
ncbi:MAG: Dabb family protein [Steroidobacteraceae bacterium]